MNQLILLVALTASTIRNPAPATTSKDTIIKKYLLLYDPSISRISGKSLPIGIVTLSADTPPTQTKGLLKGRDSWSKYKLELQGGSYSNGKNKIAKSAAAPFLAMIKAVSTPGAGGSGGRDGTGGSGGSGGSGNPSGNQGSSGMDGRSGSDGSAGSKGKVTFIPSSNS